MSSFISENLDQIIINKAFNAILLKEFQFFQFIFRKYRRYMQIIDFSFVYRCEPWYLKSMISSHHITMSWRTNLQNMVRCQFIEFIFVKELFFGFRSSEITRLSMPLNTEYNVVCGCLSPYLSKKELDSTIPSTTHAE